MSSERIELHQMSREAEKQDNLLAAGIVHIHELRSLLRKFMELPEYKPKASPRKKYSESLQRWMQKLDEDARLRGETYQEALEVQKRLNLENLPHYKRIFEYRRTGNLSVFDGLKRR